MTDIDSLEPGDFLYQADSELFLVVIDENDESVEFAAHGWREIDKERLDSYLDEEKPILQTEGQVRDVVRQSDDDNAFEKLEWLTNIFETYAENDISSESEHKEFMLDDT